MRMGEAVVVSGEKGMEVELLPEEEEEKNKEKTEEMDDECTEMAVRWEEFLPRMVLRVLLVEADDSTRQIIAALLRKCSYRVAAVADGLKAWETLKRKAPDIDLILTEVELPSISGFPLLTLIMEHDICKNIPVIMMSSNDSISMALKCMLKGAADFLIKPVRRNELSNLWQHVWRRHGISKPLQKLTYPHKKLEASSENKGASNDSSGSVASPKENNNCSEKGCEAQGPSQPKCRNSSNLSNINNVKHEEAMEVEGGSVKHKNKTDGSSISKTATYNKSINSTDNSLEEGHDYAKTHIQEGILRSELSRYDPSNNTEIHDTENELAEPCGGAIDLIATFENLPKNIDGNSSLLCDGTNKFDFDPILELSLRGDFSSSSCKQTTEKRKTLNRSNASAFSWYSGGKLLQPHFSTTPLSSSAKTNIAEWNSNEFSKLSGNIIDTSQQDSGTDHSDENRTTLVIGQSGQVETQMQNGQRRCSAMGVTSDHMSKEHGQVFPSMFSTKSGIHPIWSPKPACPKENSPFPTSASYQSNPESHNAEQRNHWPGDVTYTSDQTAKDKSNSDPVRHSSPAAGPGTSNSLCHDVANHITSDAHGSMGSKSDGNAISTTAVENTPEIFGDSGRHNYDTFRGMDSHRSSEREAALTKFRLKRKDRCFEKKVRYQSRKRLAEQRPRVKGQFVRQVHNDHPVADAGGGS